MKKTKEKMTNAVCFHLYKVSRIGEFLDTDQSNGDLGGSREKREVIV